MNRKNIIKELKNFSDKQWDMLEDLFPNCYSIGAAIHICKKLLNTIESANTVAEAIEKKYYSRLAMKLLNGYNY